MPGHLVGTYIYLCLKSVTAHHLSSEGPIKSFLSLSQFNLKTKTAAKEHWYSETPV